MPLQRTYWDYLNHVLDESPGLVKTRELVLANCGSYLDALSTFVQSRFVEISNIVNALPYGIVGDIKAAIHRAVVGGSQLYAIVAYLNNRPLRCIVLSDFAETYGEFISDDENSEKLLTRYDVVPVIERCTDAIFNSFLDEYQDLLNYPYGEVNLIRIYIYVATRNAYLTWLVCCDMFS